MTEAARMFDPLTPEESAARPNSSPDKSGRRPIIPVPEDAPQMQFKHPKHGEPTHAWPYHDAQGGLVGFMCRWDFTNAEGKPDKDFLPVAFCELGSGQRAWRSAGFPAPRPLFHLPGILAKPDVPVLVTEGEKACDAATELFPDIVCMYATWQRPQTFDNFAFDA